MHAHTHTFFLISNAKDNTKFIIGFQIDMSPITKKKFKHL